MGREQVPSDLFRAARERLPSPSGAPRPMSRQELADAVNAYLYREHKVKDQLSQDHIGRIERGRTRWPGEWRRLGFRTVLGATSDAELGFYFHRTTSNPYGSDQQPGVGHDDMLPDHAHVSGGGRDVASGVVKRRDVLTAVGGVAAGAALPASVRWKGAPAELAAALTRHGTLAHQREHGDGPGLAMAVVRGKRRYQAGQYRQVSEELPRVLDAVAAVDPRGPTQLQVLAADAYQTACSVLLKFGDAGLAMVAADRSMAAAKRSGDPVAVGASARALAHALAASGHHERAVAFALDAAKQLDDAGACRQSAGLAVYGALLLRASVVAAAGEQREAALTALAEAHEAAAQLRGNHNAYWTFFCPANVQLHRVGVAVDLGDAGQAIEHARHINPETLLLAERKAALSVDIARAYLQWSKYDKAYEALRTAEQVAPQELVARPLVRSVVAELQQRCPPSIQGPVRHLADRVRVWR